MRNGILKVRLSYAQACLVGYGVETTLRSKDSGFEISWFSANFCGLPRLVPIVQHKDIISN